MLMFVVERVEFVRIVVESQLKLKLGRGDVWGDELDNG